MRVGAHRAVSGEMLGHRGHAGFAHSREASRREGRYRIGIAVEGSIADDFAQTVIEVDAGGEAEIDSDRPQLSGKEPPHRVRTAQPLLPILIESPANQARRGQCRKALSKALHTPTLVIRRDQQMRRPDPSNGFAEL
jgi:hypothetical protein